MCMRFLTSILLFVVSFLFGIIVILLYTKVTAPKELKPLQFSLEKAPKSSIKGTISKMSGNVEWTSRIATQGAKLTSPIFIQQGEEIDTKEDGNITILFENTASISLFTNTKIYFAQTLPQSFVVEQKEGAARYNKTNNTPLAIRSLHLLTQQNDGLISVSINKDTKIVIVTTEKGSATLAYNDKEYQSNVITILEGKQAIFDDNKRQIKIINKK